MIHLRRWGWPWRRWKRRRQRREERRRRKRTTRTAAAAGWMAVATHHARRLHSSCPCRLSAALDDTTRACRPRTSQPRQRRNRSLTHVQLLFSAIRVLSLFVSLTSPFLVFISHVVQLSMECASGSGRGHTGEATQRSATGGRTSGRTPAVSSGVAAAAGMQCTMQQRDVAIDLHSESTRQSKCTG